MIQKKSQPIARRLSLDSPKLWIEYCSLSAGEVLLDSGKDNSADYASFDALLLFPHETMLLEPHEVTGREIDVLKEFEAFTRQPWMNDLGEVLDCHTWFKLQEEIGLPIPLVICSLSYELGAQIHGVKPQQDNHKAPAVWSARFNSVYLWDRKKLHGWLVGVDEIAVHRLENRILAAQCKKSSVLRQGNGVDLNGFSGFTPNCAYEQYEERFSRLQDRLLDGDIYQMNLTIPLLATLPKPMDPVDVFGAIWSVNSGQFSVCVILDDCRSILSLSPERLVKWNGSGQQRKQRYIETAPIKGTRPRCSDPDLDQKEREDLVSSIKDQAEHVMILDLERNDLGVLCKSGTVKVVKDRDIKTYATVHHLVSVVKGQLLPGLGISDILRAIFPGGSVTGAPKKRAMESIRELEFGPRGIYCGALGYLDPMGGGDLNLPIRTLVKNGEELIYHAGGGIVVDSTAKGEWEELWVKTNGFEQGLENG